MNVKRMQITFRSGHFDASVEFYEGLLGMERVTSWDRADGRGAILVASPGAGVEILGAPRGQAEFPPARHGGSVVFLVDDVAPWHERVTQSSVYAARVRRPLEDTAWGARTFGVEDPDGNLVTFFMYVGRTESEEPQ